MVEILLFLAKGIIFISYISKDILFLRLITMLGMVLNVTAVFYMGKDVPGVKGLLVFSIFTFLLNMYYAIKIMISRRPVLLEEPLKEIYLKNFNVMTPNEFLNFYKLAKHKTLKHGELMSIQGEPVMALNLITKGSVKILANNLRIKTLGSNFFIGEMSVLTGGNATATVIVESEDVEVLVWSKTLLEQMKRSNFSVYYSLLLSLSKDLINKVQKTEPVSIYRPLSSEDDKTKQKETV